MARLVFLSALGLLLAAANPWGSETSRDFAKQASEKRSSGDVAAALQLYERGHRQAVASGNITGQLKFLNSIGGCHYVQYEYQAALKSWLEARAEAEKHMNQAEEHGAILFNLASLYFATANLDAAEEAVREGNQRLRQLPFAPYYASRLHLIGAVVASRRGDLRAAHQSFRLAAEAADSKGDNAGLSQVWNYEALSHLAAKDFEAAERSLLRAFLLRRLTGDPELTATYLGLGTLELHRGNLRLAASLVDAAQELADRLQRGAARHQIHELRARIFAKRRQYAEAHTEYMRAIANIRYTRADLLPADLFRVNNEASLADLYDGMLRNAMDWSQSKSDAPANLIEQAWMAAEEWRASVASRSDADRLVAKSKLNGGYWQTLAEVRQLERRSFAPSLRPGEAATNEGERRLRALRVRLAEMESYAGIRPFSNVLAENFGTSKPLILFRDSLGSDSVLISFHLGPKVAIRWTLTKTRLEWKELPRQESLAELTGMFSKAVRTAGESKKIRELGRELYGKLFGGLSSEALQAKNWLLALDGALLQLPVAALTDDETDESGMARYLVEARSLEIVAGAQALLGKAAGDWNGVFVGVGDAVYNTADPRWRKATTQRPGRTFWGSLMAADGEAGGIELPRLISSRVELEASASAWGKSTRLLLGGDANRQRAVEAIESGAAVVHFATHFLQKETSPDRALLVLSLDPNGQPDFFSPPDAVHVKVPDSLVVLSGCHSAAGMQVPAAGLIGMTRAWLLAGARGVIASLWPTPDDTGAIFQTFYRELQKEALSSNGGGVSTKTAARFSRGMSLRNAAEALRRAQLEMLRTQTWRATPKYWGTYQLIGRTT
jgi:CHAT domain-containing protein/tetratricopeptide (TPR) repeat protein